LNQEDRFSETQSINQQFS